MNTPHPFADQVRECLAELATQEMGALGRLFDLTATRLVRFALSITRQQHDAEDAVQAVLVRLATQPHLLASASLPWPYLLRMVRNEALAVSRKMRRCQPVSDLSDLTLRQQVDPAEADETHRLVWQALRTLPEEQAEVVALKIWEGLTFAQIGEVLEISPNTAASRYRYATVKLVEKLQRWQQEGIHDG